MTYVFDLDGTLCHTHEGRYFTSRPFPERIRKVNRLFFHGHRIRVHTARGSETGLDWRSWTEHQLEAWGLRYHELIMGKPFGEVYVDDRAVLPDQFFGVVRPA